MRRRLLLGIAFLLAAGWLGVRWVERSRTVWLAVDTREMILGMPTSGELQAVVSELIGPPQVENLWNFQISMLAAEGSEVYPGQPVLSFDVSELEQRLQRAMAEADSAGKELEKTATDLEVERRTAELGLAEARSRLRKAELKASVDPTTAARSELRKAAIDRDLAQVEIEHLTESLELLGARRESELANLEGALGLARSQVVQMQAAIEQMTVKAHTAGVVVYKTDWRGEKKQVGQQVWGAGSVLEIPDLSAMRAVAEVDEAYAGRLALDQRVRLRLDAYPDREYGGRVARIRRSIQRKTLENPAKIVRFEIELDATDSERMRPGMRFQGAIVSEILHDVLSVPMAAISYDEAGPYVRLRGLLRERRVYPSLGRRNREQVEVTAGLARGDRVRARFVSAGPA